MNREGQLARQLELCWGTVSVASIDEVVAAAAEGGFAAATVTPHLARSCVADAARARAVRRMAAANGVALTVVDPLIAALPGTPGPDDVPPAYRSFFAYDEQDCFAAAEAVGAGTVNLAHFLGRQTEVGQLTEAVGAVCARAAQRGLAIALEFIPDSGIPDLHAAMAILDAVDARNAGLTLDTWHLSRSGGTVADICALPSGAIFVLQLSDRIVPPPGRPYAPMSDRLLPGDGAQDLTAIVRACLAVSPELRIGVEVFSDQLRQQPPAVAARLAGDATRRILAGVPT